MSEDVSAPFLTALPITARSFPSIDSIISSFQRDTFTSLSIPKRFRVINHTLMTLIQETPKNSFLLSAVLEYIDRVNRTHVLNMFYSFGSFEFWLNHFSELSYDEIYLIRAKIAGKHIPRSDYQPFFPVGMGRFFQGTHFVAAHLSPDVDTMIASFWGWMDAFSARIGSGLHQWSLPGGPPDSPITMILKELIAPNLFTSLARLDLTLTLKAVDLVTQQDWVKEDGNTLTGMITHGSTEKAVTLVNGCGHYLGDWRSSDFEIVRQVAILYKSILRWFENNFHTKLISLFAKPRLTLEDLPLFYSSVFSTKIGDCEPVLDFSQKQCNDIHKFFVEILKMPEGMESTFDDLIIAFKKLSFIEMSEFQEVVLSMDQHNLFDSNGNLRENRPELFHQLDALIHKLDKAMKTARNYVERLDVVIDIKHKVLHLPFVYVTMYSDVDEIRNKMQNYDYLTVVVLEQDNSLFPVGIVRDTDLRKNSLGTVSLRDFCNLNEMKKASYLEVISVVDHHKSSLQTISVPCAIIGDAQSCNVLTAEQAFIVNDRYSLGGMSAKQIDSQIQQLNSQSYSAKNARLLQRLLKRKQAASQKELFFVHPQREYTEYLCYLHAILDDTDLLSKVSKRDIDCVAELLNRMKSLSLARETEIIVLDDIPQNARFAKTAAERILMHPDMYAIYKTTFSYKEQEVERDIQSCGQGNISNFFADTKEQNGCARVGQTKIFYSNFPSFQKNAQMIRTMWLNQARENYQRDPEIVLHMYMISTISSADEVYKNQKPSYSHQDELWIWAPSSRQGYDYLSLFLTNFQSVIKNFKESLTVELCGPNAYEIEYIFKQGLEIEQITIPENHEDGLPIAILRFTPGALNSRKAMITPYLPLTNFVK